MCGTTRGRGDPATRGRLFEGHLFLQQRRQQVVVPKASRPHCRNYPEQRRRSSRSKADGVHEQDFLLVTDAGLVTVIIGEAVSLILIVIGSFFKRKIQL